MHFCYLDEAGCTGKDLTNQEQPIFVLGGISVRDEGWNRTQESLAAIVDDYFGGSTPKDFEIHAGQLLSPAGDGPFAGHDRNQRTALAKRILGLLPERGHSIHLYAIDKAKLSSSSCGADVPFDTKTPYHLAYDYMVTYINWYIKSKLGQSARGMLIIDAINQYHGDVERITRVRRFEGPAIHRVKRIAEFSYPVDSQKNPMVQLSDLVVFCTKKFLEIDNGYRNDYPQEAKGFYAECYSVIHDRISKKELVERQGQGMKELNEFLKSIQSKPSVGWKKTYGL